MSRFSDKLSIDIRSLPKAGRRIRTVLTPAEQAMILADSRGGYRSTSEDLEVQLDVERRGQNLFIRGQLTGRFAFTCSRCLTEGEWAFSSALQLTFLPAAEYRKTLRGVEELELTADDLDVSYYEGETLDLGEVIAESIHLQLPAYPVCESECEVLAVEDSERGEEEVDPRWLPLMNLKKQMH